jgi:2-oxoisovalerate dehydrogenase E1 component
MRTEPDILEEQFFDAVHHKRFPTAGPTSTKDIGCSNALLAQLFDSQLISRHLDYRSRLMQKSGQSFYTIGSAGHEGNAAIAAALRVDDMAFLHYRDGAFMVQRAHMAGQDTIIQDMLLSFAASSHDPISGGRHKVLGSKKLYIPPQTSTIASHLPKAVGAAVSIGLNKRLKRSGALKEDAIIVCSFGDASLNHSTAQGAINAASQMGYQKMHTPVLFVCEDNHIGISTPTPSGWVAASLQSKPGLRYFYCDGRNLLDVFRVAHEAAAFVRSTRLPAVLHMRCVRLMGHAGSDVQSTYLSPAQIEATNAQDPLLYSAGLMIANRLADEAEVAARYRAIATQIEEEAERAAATPKITDINTLVAPIIPPKRAPSKQHITPTKLVALEKKNLEKPMHMARLINFALHDIMEQYPNAILAGEDIGTKGGVYGVTNKLKATHGAHRVIDTLLDEQTILGLAIGMGHNGLLPIPEIQFLAYLHNAEDQLRGEAATLSFFSNGQYTNPMVVRIAGLAYQRGFGGHFHNDNSIAVLRDLPGVIVACPSSGREAVAMLRESVRLADEEQRVVVFIEPIALYPVRDLHEEGDGLWACSYHDASSQPAIGLGEVATHGMGRDLAIVTYGNGTYLSLQAQKTLKDVHDIDARIIDLRWLHPLPIESMRNAIKGCRHVLVVDECRRSGSPSEALIAALVETERDLVSARLCAEDTFIPLGNASRLPLPSKESIVEHARALLADASS